MNRRSLPIFMCITILVICAFQVYWVRDNYIREKKTMQLKAAMAFEESIRELQSFNLKLPDSLGGFPVAKGKRILIHKDPNQDVGEVQRKGVVTMVNVMRRSGRFDSTKLKYFRSDTAGGILQEDILIHNDRDTGILPTLLRVDALQETLKPEEIQKRTKAALQELNMNIPFSFIVKDGISHEPDDQMAVVTGFARPVTYHLTLGNTFPYLLNQIALPLLFSLFLVTVTIICFVLLYRNLLRQHKLVEMKNDFISNITHELKTPIATVSVAIEAMKNFNAINDREKTKEYLDISSSELQRLDLLADNVLRVSLFEKKQVQLVHEPVDLKKLIQEVLDTLRLQFEKNKAQVSFTAPEQNVTINGDKFHLMSVLYNLIDNALKYKRNDPVIEINLLQEHGNAIIQVADNGIGIDPAYRSRIFDKFFRVPAGNNHAVKGYGLGLSYVSHIVEQHKGTIAVKSEPGSGSTFTITFPG